VAAVSLGSYRFPNVENGNRYASRVRLTLAFEQSIEA